MSHISVFKTKISNPNKSLLETVLQAIAQQYQAQIFTNIAMPDKYVVVKGDYILKFPNGRCIGINCKEKLEIVGDGYGWQSEFDNIKNTIVQTYIHFALLQQLQKMGYKLNYVQKVGNAIVGEVVR